MTDLPAPTLPPLRLPATPEPRPLDKLLSTSGPIFAAVFDPYRAGRDVTTLRSAIGSAEGLLVSASTIGKTLAEAVEVEKGEDIKRQLAVFVEAWPNASRGDLAGYGLQLATDVAERHPCRYALWSALRHLRQTSRFLPSIAEVLAALDEAQKRIRNTAWHLQQLPAVLEHARADLAKAEARERRPFHGTPEAVGEGAG